jgi:hypothetical protein
MSALRNRPGPLDSRAQKKFKDAATRLKDALPKDSRKILSTIKFPDLSNVNVNNIGSVALELSQVLEAFIDERENTPRTSKAKRIVQNFFRASYPFAEGLLTVFKDGAAVIPLTSDADEDSRFKPVRNCLWRLALLVKGCMTFTKLI